MDITSYPRPSGDTGIGFHWFPDAQHYDKSYLKRFGPELKALGASWLVLVSAMSEAVPEHFIKGLKERGIEPIVRLSTPFASPVDMAQLAQTGRQYAGMGVRYLFLYHEPNHRSEWAKWPGADAPDQFMGFALPALETLARTDDVIPLFPPLAPGGDLNDRLFLDRCMEILSIRGSTNLQDKLAVAIHNYTRNKPLSWGHGAAQAWPASLPGRCPEGSEDHDGFCLHEWYQEIIQNRLGRAALMFAAANGPVIGDKSQPAYPAVDETIHACLAAGMAQAMMGNEVPLYLVNTAFWLVAAEDGDPFASYRWYRSDGTPVLPNTIQALKGLSKRARLALSVPQRVTVLLEDGKIANMDMDEYVMGVVPREIPATSASQALKAQAIAARTFAARAVQHPRHGAAAVCTTSHCQCWSANHNPRVDQAVRETHGVVLVFNDELIGAYYFGHCDGHTRNSEDVWRAALPYCRSVPCICGNAEMYGHGVGMCQEGAIRMAIQGALAHEILNHYYTGARVQRADGTLYEE